MFFLTKNVTNILLLIIVTLLVSIFFKEKVGFYLKAQEVLERVSYYNISDVALKCYKGVIADEEDWKPPSKECSDMIDSYRERILRWNSLIKKYRDIDCNDFADRGEAQDFYEYISGELTDGFYAYRIKVKGLESDNTESFKFSGTNIFDGHCRYDPYGLDINSDCNACENY